MGFPAQNATILSTNTRTRQRWLTTAAVTVLLSLPIVILVVFNWVLSIAFEGPVETSDWDALRRERAARLGIVFDARSWREVRGECGMPRCLPFINPLEEFEPDNGFLPVAPGPNHSRVVGCNETGKWTFMTTDLFGFNGNNDDQYRTRQEVVLIGDSFAQGACVQPGESLADRLRSSDRGVLNLGVGGHQPLGELAVLKEYLPPTDVLVWVYFEGNDFALDEKNRVFLGKYLERGFSQGLQNRTADINRMFEKAISEREQEVASTAKPPDGRVRSVVRDWFNPSLSALAFIRGRFQRPEIQTDYELFARLLDEVHAFARDERQTRSFIFVYLPTYERFAWRPRSHPQVEKFDRLRTEIARIATAHGWTFVDVAHEFEKQSDPLSLFPFRTHAHYTAAGYEIAFQALNGALPDR